MPELWSTAIGMDAPVLGQFDRRTPDHEGDVLGQPDFVQFVFRGKKAGFLQQDIPWLHPVLFDGIDSTAENRIGIAQAAP